MWLNKCVILDCMHMAFSLTELGLMGSADCLSSLCTAIEAMSCTDMLTRQLQINHVVIVTGLTWVAAQSMATCTPVAFSKLCLLRTGVNLKRLITSSTCSKSN